VAIGRINNSVITLNGPPADWLADKSKLIESTRSPAFTVIGSASARVSVFG
jgi:hypothetical protein